MKLSKDIYSHNVIIELNQNGCIRARVIKDIAENHELITWFSEEILISMNIPFLTPINIRGNNCYKCHHCYKIFEYPNPLKIHLATACEQENLDMLWMKLHYTIMKTASVATEQQRQQQQQQQEQMFNQQQTLKSSIFFRNDILMRSTLAATFERRHESAFKPIHQSSIRHSILPLSQHPHHYHHHHYNNRQQQQQPRQHHQLESSSISLTQLRRSSHRQLPSAPVRSASVSSTVPAADSGATVTTDQTTTNVSVNISKNAAEAAALNAAQQIETIVSNMGASKQGHLCIYCGKIYSRKYGLKIHIRTHTGFKPLKCKFCLRPFGDPSNLNKHVRLHLQTGNLTYRCHLCHKTLARRRDLQRHIETKHCLLEEDTQPPVSTT